MRYGSFYVKENAQTIREFRGNQLHNYYEELFRQQKHDRVRHRTACILSCLYKTNHSMDSGFFLNKDPAETYNDNEFRRKI